MWPLFYNNRKLPCHDSINGGHGKKTIDIVKGESLPYSIYLRDIMTMCASSNGDETGYWTKYLHVYRNWQRSFSRRTAVTPAVPDRLVSMCRVHGIYGAGLGCDKKGLDTLACY